MPYKVIYDRRGWSGTGQCPVVRTMPDTVNGTAPLYGYQKTIFTAQFKQYPPDGIDASTDTNTLNALFSTNGFISGNPTDPPPQPF